VAASRDLARASSTTSIGNTVFVLGTVLVPAITGLPSPTVGSLNGAISRFPAVDDGASDFGVVRSPSAPPLFSKKKRQGGSDDSTSPVGVVETLWLVPSPSGQSGQRNVVAQLGGLARHLTEKRAQIQTNVLARNSLRSSDEVLDRVAALASRSDAILPAAL
jgi:hypothetical protein